MAAGTLGNRLEQGGRTLLQTLAQTDRRHGLRHFLAVPADNPVLAVSQMEALSRQIPMLYAILTINAISLAWTHAHTAPLILTFILPGVLVSACLVRAAVWMTRGHRAVTSTQAVARLKVTMWLVPFMGVTFTAWALSLYPYGDAYAKCHVAFYMSFTAMGCILCLVHLRGAALMLMAVVLLPFCIFFIVFGDFVLKAISVNLLLVSFAMIVLLMRNYDDFTTMIISQRELQVRQAETHGLYQENSRLANLDALTGLPNRRQFLANLDDILQSARKNGTRFAVALIDLDGFKGVNDVHGHAAGDRLLEEVGRRLASIADSLVTVARLGGDEFVATLSGDPDESGVRAFGERLCALLRGPYLLGGIMADVAGSAGLAAYPQCGETAEQLFERADYALYYAKQTRTGQAVTFSDKHAAMIRDAVRLELALRHADFEREMWLAFQPLVDAVTGLTIGFEALARWNSPVLGPVGPDVFIPVAERAGMISKLSMVLLAKALRAAACWPPAMRIAFNLSAHDLAAPNIVANVVDTVAASTVQPSRIDLEITETAVMRDTGAAADAIAAFRKMGMRISLDDFGTGYSSLSHVHRLKPEKIKIDRSFVTFIREDQASRDIVRTVVDLCRNLSMECVVEGVETEAQMRILSSLGCRVMQGYLFGRPMPEADVAHYLDSEQDVLAAFPDAMVG